MLFKKYTDEATFNIQILTLIHLRYMFYSLQVGCVPSGTGPLGGHSSSSGMTLPSEEAFSGVDRVGKPKKIGIEISLSIYIYFIF